MEKSHVSMEQRKCKICTKDYDTNAILLDRRLKASMERHTLTGWGICPECQGKIDTGFIAMIVIDANKSEIINGIIKPSDAWRTGEILFMKKEPAMNILNPFPGEISFIDQEACLKIRSMIEV